nr:glycosyltransferase [uncultured Pedobacter sp.]
MVKSRKTIVVSGVNLVVGGTLTILRDCLSYLSSLPIDEYKIVAVVHKKELASYPNIEYIEIPWAKKNWIYRLWCEYYTFKNISKTLSPVYLWLSLHDTSPNVLAQRRAVYCHNSFPFYNWGFMDIFFNYKIVLFAMFSKWAYYFNIKKNDFVIIQQQWLKDEFINIFGLERKKLLIAYPDKSIDRVEVFTSDSLGRENLTKPFKFFFASSASTHKNFHLICQASKNIEESGITDFEVYLTINPTGNKYERWLYKKFSNVKSISFIGFLKKDDLVSMYQRSDCFIFPSKIETWGLPISEFAKTNKPMLLADLPYARSTAKGSNSVAFFNPNNVGELESLMKSLMKGDNSFLKKVDDVESEEPYTYSWAQTFDLLLYV